MTAALCVFIATRTMQAQTTVPEINLECNAIQDAVMALKPIHVAYRSSHWVVLSDADFAVAQQTKPSITLADVYKQGTKYAWVHAHTFDSQGNQHAIFNVADRGAWSAVIAADESRNIRAAYR